MIEVESKWCCLVFKTFSSHIAHCFRWISFPIFISLIMFIEVIWVYYFRHIHHFPLPSVNICNRGEKMSWKKIVFDGEMYVIITWSFTDLKLGQNFAVFFVIFSGSLPLYYIWLYCKKKFCKGHFYRVVIYSHRYLRQAKYLLAGGSHIISGMSFSFPLIFIHIVLCKIFVQIYK